MITANNLINKIDFLERQNKKLALYLNHLKVYKLNLENTLKKIESSKMYKVWRFYKMIFNKLNNPIRKAEEKKLWHEIDEFNHKNTNNLTIINFGVIPYNSRQLRQQHLVEQLASKGHRIFYIENEFTEANKNNNLPFQIKKQRENIYIVTLSCARNLSIYFQEANEEDIKSLTFSLRSLINKASIVNPVAKIDHPFWAYLLKAINMLIVYDCMEDYEGFELTGDKILDLEKMILKRSDLVIVCSNSLRKKFEKYLPKNTILLKNAGDYDFFKNTSRKILPTPLELRRTKKPIIGYYGAIDKDLFDDKLLKKIADSFKNISIILIGHVKNRNVINLVKEYKNIYTLGEKSYYDLPQYLQEFDICLIPFVSNKSTKMIDPVKLYEYLASGKPIVTSNISEIMGYKSALYISKDHQDFIDNIKKALKEKDKKLFNKRRKIAKQNTWEKRGNVLDIEIRKILRKPYNGV